MDSECRVIRDRVATSLGPRQIAAILLVCLLFIVNGEVFAQAPARGYPQRVIHIVVPFPPGGGIDSVARIVGLNLQTALGQPVLVENRVGAGGLIAADYVAKSPPDGYTLLGSAPTLSIGPSLHDKLSFNPETDLAPVTRLTTSPTILVVNPSVPARSVEELIALARSMPGKINFASGGIGTTQHMAAELLKYLARIDVVHVPYKGSVPAQNDLIAGRCSFMFVEPAMLSVVNSGKLRGLAVSTAKRYSKAPELPTIAESGLPGYESTTWYGLLAPGGTPRDIVTLLNREVTKILNNNRVQESLLGQGYEPSPETSEQFAQYLHADIARWAAVVKASGVKLE